MARPGRRAPVKLLRTACRRPIVVAALKVALVVGTVLNLINQGGWLLDGLQPSWAHVLLNYLVPYCVSSYSAARNEMRHDVQPCKDRAARPV